jgi:hypothetical protein
MILEKKNPNWLLFYKIKYLPNTGAKLVLNCELLFRGPLWNICCWPWYYQGKEIVFRFITEYSSFRDFGPWVIIIGLF